ncbi:Tfp pilus assembly protein FimT/FimU [uncultured Megasphaera sp.]|uniref:pilus assembly FimT family protein n=1 Tax=uncultured Megasphaera sp. TaxID=165188 RepID=UPI00265946D6|nr:hypothetical protein [uncultured Megasphaera sp.]
MGRWRNDSFLDRVRRNNGFVSLTECMIVLVLLGLVAMTVMPSLVWHPQRRQVDVLTRELAIELQLLRQHALTNGLALNDSRRLLVYRHRYVIQRQYMEQKTRTYPDGVIVRVSDEGRKEFSFNQKGRPRYDMEVIISDSDRTYERKIVVAAQTGRIRLE